jgi:hypothetical protein
MLRLIAVAGIILSVATSAQAMTPAPPPQADEMVTRVAVGCGPGRTESMAYAWHGPPSVRLAEPSADACDGRVALARCTSERTGPVFSIALVGPVKRSDIAADARSESWL